MLTFQQARQIAESEISKQQFSDNDSLIIIDELTIEKEYAWIFSYTSKRYWETEYIMDAIGGNGPIFISKSDGQISNYRTGLSIDKMIDEHEEANKIWNLVLSNRISVDPKQLLALRQVVDMTIEEIKDFKKNDRQVLVSGSRTKLTSIRNHLNSKNIQTEIQQRN